MSPEEKRPTDVAPESRIRSLPSSFCIRTRMFYLTSSRARAKPSDVWKNLESNYACYGGCLSAINHTGDQRGLPFPRLPFDRGTEWRRFFHRLWRCRLKVRSKPDGGIFSAGVATDVTFLHHLQADPHQIPTKEARTVRRTELPLAGTFWGHTIWRRRHGRSGSAEKGGLVAQRDYPGMCILNGLSQWAIGSSLRSSLF